MGQRSFEKCKPWYVIINTLRNTCCCRYHVEYEYYFEKFSYTRHVLHTNHVQDCSPTIPPTSSREFIHSIMCNRPEGKTYYEKYCLDGTCSNYAGMALLSQCMHESGDNEFGNMVIDMKSFKYISYEIGPRKERKKIRVSHGFGLSKLERYQLLYLENPSNIKVSHKTTPHLNMVCFYLMITKPFQKENPMIL